MAELDQKRDRLDSWKAIATYLKRDLATVRRWEKGLGLPVHRVAGRGRSVFAYAAEIDDWLKTSKLAIPVSPPSTGRHFTRASRWLLLAAAGVAVLIVGLVRSRSLTPVDLQVVVTSAGVVARDAAGVEQWRYGFPATHYTHIPRAPLLVTSGGHQGVYVATSYRGRQAEDRIESGALTLLDRRGRLQRSFSFDDEVTFQGKVFAAPWAVTSFAVNESGTVPLVAVAAHHYEWDPGLVTILDQRWQRRGTFVHAGWIEVVRWVGPARLLIGGFSNAHDGGMLTLLDSNALDGQGPEPPGSRHHCQSCGSDAPVRMIVLPRSEINRVSGSPFNRALVNTQPDRISVRTIEVPSPAGDADVVYEFSPSLDLISARFSDRYWEIHRALEADGRITHPREQCDQRDGPQAIRVWEPSSGWRSVDAS